MGKMHPVVTPEVISVLVKETSCRPHRVWTHDPVLMSQNCAFIFDHVTHFQPIIEQEYIKEVYSDNYYLLVIYLIKLYE